MHTCMFYQQCLIKRDVREEERDTTTQLIKSMFLHMLVVLLNLARVPRV